VLVAKNYQYHFSGKGKFICAEHVGDELFRPTNKNAYLAAEPISRRRIRIAEISGRFRLLSKERKRPGLEIIPISDQAAV
jgi:hypothetical protein